MIQQLLMQFTGTLNRRRAYAATHPMVREAEERLLAIVQGVLTTGEALSIGVARSELLINGTPYETTGSFARELAQRLHRRGVGAVLLEPTVTIEQLRAAMAWLASDPESVADTPPTHDGVRITTLEYDHLVLDEEARNTTTAVVSLWRTLADLAAHDVKPRDPGGHGRPGGAEPDSHDAGAVFVGAISGSDTVPAHTRTHSMRSVANGELHDALGPIADDRPDSDVDDIDTETVLAKLRISVGNPAVAHRAATALLKLATVGRHASPEVRDDIGRQLHRTLQRLGSSSFAPIIRSLADRAQRRTFVTQIVEVLPIGAVVDWLTAAATADEQQMSHQVLRLMAKMSTLTEERGDATTESYFRDAAHELVAGWALDDPNPAEHVELLDRIASFERTGYSRDVGQQQALDDAGYALVESARLVQMALEIDVVGDDTTAAAEAMVVAGAGQQLMQYITSSPNNTTAQRLLHIATSEKAVRITLLSEPVDRLQARALLKLLDASSASTLVDVLEKASTRGTRMIVRQRLAEFGEVIKPLLVARLEHAPWFLIRNILTLLLEIAVARGGTASASDFMMQLLKHEQAQVRVEALRVLLHDAGYRDAALRCALHDDAERVVLLAVQSVAEAAEAGAHLPAAVVTQLMTIVNAGAHGDTVRARAVRALAKVQRDDVRDWMVRLVARRSRFLRRLTLAEPTQTAISALQVLRRVHGTHPDVLQLVARVTRTASDTRWLQKDTSVTMERST